MTKEWESRIKMWITALENKLYTPAGEMEFTFFTTMGHLSYEEAMKVPGMPVREGQPWGKEWEYGWFMTSFHLGEWSRGKRIVMNLDLGGEAVLFVNGQVFGTRRADWVKTGYHYLCDNYVTRESSGNEEVFLAAECYAGHSRPGEIGEATAGPVQDGYLWERPYREHRTRLGKCTYGIWNEEAYHLLLKVRVLYDIWKNGDQDSLRSAQVQEALQEFTLRADLSLEGERLQESLQSCHEYLKPFLACLNGSTVPQMHAVGHAHIDLAWFWSQEETERKGARTMAAQLRHMEEYPEYKMILSQPQLYEMIREHYPELFEKMKQRAQSGQLIPEGGMWVEADTNIPSGESLIRQFLYGKKYFREEFGVDSRLLWLPDVFGYCAALPQIMKGCGIRYFATAKIFWTYNGGEQFPYHYFNWKGIDGTRVESFIHMDYNSFTSAEALIQKWKGRRQREGLKRMLVSVGYGDGGGGVCRDHVENVRLLNNCEGVPSIFFDHPNHFFEMMEEEAGNVPEYAGELYFQAHRGTYTTQAAIKKNNRRCELALREAELWCVLADEAELMAYPGEGLEQNWKALLKNQFHDILPGSAIHKVYERAGKELGEVLAYAEEKAMSAAEALLNGTAAEKIKQKEALTVFNSLSWERNVMVKLPEGWKAAQSSKGEPLPIQRGKDGIYARVTVPSMGTQSIRPVTASTAAQSVRSSIPSMGTQSIRSEMPSAVCHPITEEYPPDAATDGNVMENDCMRLMFNSRGEIVSLFDKESRTEWAAEALNVMRLYQDVPSHYEAWDVESIRRQIPEAQAQNAVITMEAQGPLYCEMKVEKTIGHSKVIQWIRLEQDSKRIVFCTKIDWQETQKLLKVDFPVNVTTDELISEIQFGYVKRPNHKSREYDRDRFEVCNHKWSALAEPGRGCALLNDSKYGISCQDNRMELTLLRAPVFPDESADRGIQEFTYAFTFWNCPMADSHVVNQAYELNVRPFVLKGERPFGSFLKVDNTNIIIDCVKKAEIGNRSIVIRAYESMGSRTRTNFYTDLPVKSCVESDMLEAAGRSLSISGGKVELEFAAFEVKTIILSV